WPDNAIQNEWLQVTVLADGNTGLTSPAVFYFGNAIGDSGDSTANTNVNAADELGARANQRNFTNPAPINFNYDFNRYKKVEATGANAVGVVAASGRRGAGGGSAGAPADRAGTLAAPRLSLRRHDLARGARKLPLPLHHDGGAAQRPRRPR